MKKRYIFEGEIFDQEEELVGRLRYFFKVENDEIAKGLAQVVSDSINKSLLNYYGENSLRCLRVSQVKDL